MGSGAGASCPGTRSAPHVGGAGLRGNHRRRPRLRALLQRLARTTATPAAFLHDTLVIWVVLLAGPLLHERAARWNIAAIALLVGGEVALSKGIGHLAWGTGTALVLAATLLWAVEVVVAKRLLSGIAPATVSLVRMGVGSAALLAYLGSHGRPRCTVRPQPWPVGLGPVHRAAAGRLRRHMDDRARVEPGPSTSRRSWWRAH